MKAEFSPFNFFSSGVRRASACVAAFVLLAGTLGTAATATFAVEQKNAIVAARMSEDKRILHVLNRLGFGARPGDVERVRQMGLPRYIEQQLHPETLDNSAAESRLQNFQTLNLTTAQIYAQYPTPGVLLRQLQKRGDLPVDLQAAVQNRKEAKASAKPDEAMPPAPNDTAAKLAAAKNPNAETYRRAIRDFMIQNHLKPPQQVLQELQASRIIRATYSDRQLYEQTVDFWENHFNVFAGKGADRWRLTVFDRDTIRPYAFGKFRDLLEATAKSPAMLFYLDNFQSVSPGAPHGNPNRQLRGQQINGDFGGGFGKPRGLNLPRQQNPAPPQQAIQNKKVKRGLNEHYARELMELHTLGVDGGYTQQDVIEVARCFTGWTIFDPRGYTASVAAIENKGDSGMSNLAQNSGKFYFNARLHDNGEKSVLGQKIPAGGGMKDAEMVLDILSHNPTTAKFISTKVARWFVNDEPSASLVARMSDTFLKSDGDIREVLRTMIASPEFNAADAYRAKIKTPFELAVSSIRALGGDTNGSPALIGWIAKMGQPLYGYQTPNGYPDRAEQWVSTGSLLERLNFALALVGNKIPGTHIDVSRFVNDNADHERIDFRRNRLINQFTDLILQGDISEKTKAGLLKSLSETAMNPQSALISASTNGATTNSMSGEQIASVSDDQQQFKAKGGNGKRQNYNVPPIGNAVTSDVQRVAALILGSPEFQRQ
ncbi:MAG: hypothetical protein NVSMB56_10030 [Pyrinomonadaceae bacterium]